MCVGGGGGGAERSKLYRHVFMMLDTCWNYLEKLILASTHNESYLHKILG